MPRILVTDALGQIRNVLVPALRQRHGADAVVASDVRVVPDPPEADGPFVVDSALKLRFRSTSEYGASCQVASGAYGGS